MIEISERRILILYASQTGTAEEVSNQIKARLKRLHFQVEIATMDEYYQTESNIFTEDLIIFVCATTGQGVPPKNMIKFWNALRRSHLPVDFLDNVRFTLFGLGDSSYPKFNWVAKKLNRRLIQLGAQLFHEIGLADDQNINGVDSTLLPWLKGLIQSLKRIKPIQNDFIAISDEICLPPTFLLKKTSPSNLSNQQEKCSLQLSNSNLVTLSKNTRLTSTEHFQDTRHIELDFEHSIQFEPGAVCEILPENDSNDLDKLFKLMGWSETTDLDEIYELTPVESNQKIPTGWKQFSTIRSIFKTRLDFTRVPNRSFFDWIRFFAKDEIERSRLIEFCSIEGQDDLFEYINKPRRTILEVLSEFKSVKIPLDYIHDVFPTIRPRQFSIASSPKLFPNQVHLLVAILEYKTRLSVPRKGLCTHWISQLEPGARIQVRITNGYVKFPKEPTEPIICIGPGTGIAPFRSLIQHRSTMINDIKQPISSLVFFGCRFESKDFYYRQEWNLLVEKNACQFFWIASRDQRDKLYVQDLLIQNSDLVWNFLSIQNGSVIISGSAGEMPRNVRSCLLKIFQSSGGLDLTQANEFLNHLESNGKFQEDTWS